MGWTSSSDGEQTRDSYKKCGGEPLGNNEKMDYRRQTVRISRWNYPRDMSNGRPLYQ
jgi:hypothetical protein